MMFRLDSKFHRLMTKVFDLLVLNILFFLFCIPLFTIGANLTALYSVTMRLAKNDAAYPIKLYFQAFKDNFKQATIYWLMFVVVGFLLYWDYQLIKTHQLEIQFLPYLIIFFLILIVLYAQTCFPLLAQFPNYFKIPFIS